MLEQSLSARKRAKSNKTKKSLSSLPEWTLAHGFPLAPAEEKGIGANTWEWLDCEAVTKAIPFWARSPRSDVVSLVRQNIEEDDKFHFACFKGRRPTPPRKPACRWAKS
jgi:hypothetical protein